MRPQPDFIHEFVPGSSSPHTLASCTARVETSVISFRLDASLIRMLHCLVRAEKFWRTECRGSFDDWPKVYSIWKI